MQHHEGNRVLILATVLCEAIVQAWIKGHRTIDSFMNSSMDNFMEQPFAMKNRMNKFMAMEIV